MSKPKPPKNYRKINVDSCVNCEYLRTTKGTMGFVTYDCERGNPRGWDYIHIQQYVCDGHKKEGKDDS